MNEQPNFLDLPLVVSSTRAVSPPEHRRLSAQNTRILERLKVGPMSTDELAKISRKYTSRISDLRKAGHDVECFIRNHRTGVNLYRLNR